ncbi:MAG: hypothetical protein ABIP75_11780, partial [Pyrinomonadaceae bacterium]
MHRFCRNIVDQIARVSQFFLRRPELLSFIALFLLPLLWTLVEARVGGGGSYGGGRSSGGGGGRSSGGGGFGGSGGGGSGGG